MGNNNLLHPLQIRLNLLILQKRAFLPPQFLQLGFDFLRQQGIYFLDLLVLFSHRLECFFLAFLKHACPGGFFEHGEDFDGFHVEDFGDSALHDEKVWVVDVELDGLEEVLDGLLLGAVAVDEVLALAAHHNLPEVLETENKHKAR